MKPLEQPECRPPPHGWLPLASPRRVSGAPSDTNIGWAVNPRCGGTCMVYLQVIECNEFFALLVEGTSGTWSLFCSRWAPQLFNLSINCIIKKKRSLNRVCSCLIAHAGCSRWAVACCPPRRRSRSGRSCWLTRKKGRLSLSLSLSLSL